VPAVKRQIVEMRLNGRGVRDMARVLQVSPNTGMGELKKRPQPSLRATRSLAREAVRKRAGEKGAVWRRRRSRRWGVALAAKPSSGG
jgi:InsA C-terminal domain